MAYWERRLKCIAWFDVEMDTLHVERIEECKITKTQRRKNKRIKNREEKRRKKRGKTISGHLK